jgi:Outer membrane protein beta-barrel domain
MPFPLRFSLMRRISAVAAVVLLAAGVSHAQSTASQTQPNSSNETPSSTRYSSSQSGMTQTELAEFAAPGAPTPNGSPSGRAGAGQYGSGGGGGSHGFLHNRSWTFEAGGGFNAPIGNDTPFISWGGNFTVGGGLRLSNRLSALLEYQFMDNKLPGAFIASFPAQDQITAGNSHINSITGSPVIDLFPKKSNGIYLVGGFGWYRKSTNLQSPEPTFDEFGDEFIENVTVASITSNQWGGNAGFGLYHRLGNMYGDTSHTEIFAEARYTFLNTPKPNIQNGENVSNGFGTTELIPVTLGIRF